MSQLVSYFIRRVYTEHSSFILHIKRNTLLLLLRGIDTSCRQTTERHRIHTTNFCIFIFVETETKQAQV